MTDFWLIYGNRPHFPIDLSLEKNGSDRGSGPILKMRPGGFWKKSFPFFALEPEKAVEKEELE
jgi:hypothetical protein